MNIEKELSKIIAVDRLNTNQNINGIEESKRAILKIVQTERRNPDFDAFSRLICKIAEEQTIPEMDMRIAILRLRIDFLDNLERNGLHELISEEK